MDSTGEQTGDEIVKKGQRCLEETIKDQNWNEYFDDIAFDTHEVKRKNGEGNEEKIIVITYMKNLRFKNNGGAESLKNQMICRKDCGIY